MLVKSLRQKNNWSQEQLAQFCGLNICTIQRVEKGDTVGLETLKSLAAVFDIDVDTLKNENISANTTHVSKDTHDEREKRENKKKQVE